MGFAAVLLLTATALHAGFQLTVTVLVYPTLVRVDPTAFAAAHAVHSRRITPLVALVYGAVVVASVVAVATDPASAATWTSAVASAAAILVTALRAAPLHGRLGREGPRPALLLGLVRADRVRTVAALVALAAAVVHATTG